jgi:hypothetical protein
MLGTMRTLLLTLTFLAGALGLIGTALWSFAGAGIYGSPFGGMDAGGARAVVLLLLVGPLSLFPAGLMARKHPMGAGLFLVGSAVFCFFWHLGVIMREGFDKLFRPNPQFEAWIPVLLLSGAPLLLGSGFLWLSRNDLAATLKRPAFQRGLAILGIGAAAILLVLAAVWKLTAPVWVVSVEPAGKPALTLRFDPRDVMKRQADLERILQPLFATVPATTGVTNLGTVTLRRKDARDGGTINQTLSLWTTHTPEGFLIVRLDQATLHYYFEFTPPVTPEDLKAVEQGALKSAQEELRIKINSLALTSQER